MRGRVLAVLLIGVLLVVGLAVLGFLLRGGDEAPAPVTAPPAASRAPEARTPDDFGRAACVRLRLAAQGISANSAADSVRRELAKARVLAGEALRGDGRYASLSGAAAALDEAIRNDDGVAAVTSLRVALDACDALEPAG